MNIQRDINFNNVNKSENNNITVWRITNDNIVTLSDLGVNSVFKSLELRYLNCVKLRISDRYFKSNKNHYNQIKISEYDTKRY